MTAILDLAAAKETLSITGSDHDVRLAGYVAAAVETVNELCGPTDPTPVTETVDGVGAIVLTTTPVLRLTSVTGHGGGSLDVSTLRIVSPLSGVVRPYVGRLPGDVWTVSYLAGRPTVPAAIVTGAKIILQALWATQRGPTRGARGDDTEMSAVPGLGMAIPRRALLALDKHLLGPAVG